MYKSMKQIVLYIIKKVTFLNFYITTLIKHEDLPFYDEVINNITNKPIVISKSNTKTKNKPYLIEEIPPFIQTKLNKKMSKFSFKRITGFLVDLKGVKSIEDYMNNQFGAKSRSKIRSYIRRLNTCFNISYKMYYGDIERTEYEKIFNTLDRIIEERFKQRGENHNASKYWNFYRGKTYKLLKEKKASIFVIYDNDKPIDICINFHYDAVLLNDIRAFDIDYAKFRIGYIDIYKQLEWCLENNISIFDLSAGVFSYKKQWCNVTYKNTNEIIYRKYSFKSMVISFCLYLMFKIKILLSNKGFIFDKIDESADMKDLPSYHNKGEKVDIFNFKINKYKTTKDDILTPIDIEDSNYKPLRKSLYDYLYLNFENKNHIKLFKIENQINTFYLEGKDTVKFTL